MCNYRSKLGKMLVALFFALPLITSPVYADDTIPEPGDNPGNEWSGEIVDPTPQPAPTPEPTPQPQPQPAPQPAPQPTPATPRKPVATPVATETVVETPEEEAPVEEAPVEEAPEEVLVEETEVETEETPVVPETLTPAESEDAIKIKIIALISTIIVFFSGIIIWTVARLYRINKFEKIYKDALKKSHEIKKAGITRAG